MKTIKITHSATRLSQIASQIKIQLGITLIKAQPGFGKSYWVNHYLLDKYSKSLFLAPTRSILEQQQQAYEDYHKSISLGGEKSNLTSLGVAEFKTYQSFFTNPQLLKLYNLIILDEVQWLGILAEMATEEETVKIVKFVSTLIQLKKTIPIVWLSATPGVVLQATQLFSIDTFYDIEFTNICQPTEVLYIPYHGQEPVINILTEIFTQEKQELLNGGEAIIYLQNPVPSYAYRAGFDMELVKNSAPMGRVGTLESTEHFAATLQTKIPWITVDFCDKNTILEQKFSNLNYGYLNKPITVCTSVLLQGVSLLSPNLKYVIVASSRLDDIIQFAARPRNSNFKLIVINDCRDVENIIPKLPEVGEILINNSCGSVLKHLYRRYALKQEANMGIETLQNYFKFSKTKKYFTKPTGSPRFQYATGFAQVPSSAVRKKKVLDLRQQHLPPDQWFTLKEMTTVLYQRRWFWNDVKMIRKMEHKEQGVFVRYRFELPQAPTT